VPVEVERLESLYPEVVAGIVVLADVVALQSEISAIPIYDGMRTNLFPVTFDAADVRVIEYDCVMCRRA